MMNHSETSYTHQHHSGDDEDETQANASVLHVSNHTHQHTHYHYSVTIQHVNHQCGTATLSDKPTVRVFTKAHPNYSLTIRDGKVILAQSNPNDDYQHWYKIDKYSTYVKDEEGCPAFSLVNKVTGEAIKHSTGATNPAPSIACVSTRNDNIIINPLFEDGLNNWSGKGCKVMLHDSLVDGKILPLSGKSFASAMNRKQGWNGIQQEITGRVQQKLAYEVTASVRIIGNNVTSPDIIVKATLWVQTPDFREHYIGIANVQATVMDWATMKGKFVLDRSPLKVIIYIEGPPPGIDILVDSLSVKPAAKTSPSTPSDAKVCLVPYNPCIFDESILWTEAMTVTDGYRAIRVVNSIHLNVEAFGGGEVHDGTTIILRDWNEGDNQRWKILPYCKSKFITKKFEFLAMLMHVFLKINAL